MGSSHARLWRCWQKFGWALTLTSAVTSPALTLACATGVTGPDSQNPPEPASTSSFGPLFLRGGSAGSGTGADFRRSGLRCDSWGRPSRPSVQVLSVLPATLFCCDRATVVKVLLHGPLICWNHFATLGAWGTWILRLHILLLKTKALDGSFYWFTQFTPTQGIHGLLLLRLTTQ